METSGPWAARDVVAPLQRVLWGADRRRPPPRPGPRRWRRLRVFAFPIGVLALIGLGFGAGSYLTDSRGMNQFPAIVIAVGSVLPIVLALRAPLMAWRIAFVMQFVGVIGAKATDAWPWNPVQIFGFLFVLFVVALTQDSSVTAWVTVFSVIPAFLFALNANAWGAAILVVVVALLGDQIARPQQSRRVIAEQEEVNELERARRAVLEERARIAREMHDVVAHHMSMIAVQAETAPYRVADLPDTARAELATIATAARSALADMRRLLGVLRQEDDDTPRAPQPGLADIPDLVATAKRAGVPVTLAMPAGDGVPEAVGLTAYRIVQEALANAARHAPGGPVRVAGRVQDGRLELAVRNGPAVPGIAPSALPGEGHGHGLMGMRERATLLGGTLSAGRDENGGYTIAAMLPFGGAE
jgi:signal transduction histidine kinase